MDLSIFVKYELSEKDYVILCPQGSRITRLVLGGVTIIQSRVPYNDLGSGSFLMYPWVNRLEKPQPPYEPQFTDAKGLPLHGMVVNALENALSTKDEKIITLTIKPDKLEVPNFTQIFTLEPSKFTIHMKVEETSNLPICFGYHPYFQINDQNIVNLTIQTNIVTNIKLSEDSLLPFIPITQKYMQIKTSEKYDHLFKHSENNDGYLRLKKLGGPTVEIKSSDMKYWQVYTPPDGKRIAIEPMTFMGNIYSLYSQQKYGKLPTEASFTITVK